MSEFDPNNYPKKPSRLDILKNRLARSMPIKAEASESLHHVPGSGSVRPDEFYDLQKEIEADQARIAHPRVQDLIKDEFENEGVLTNSITPIFNEELPEDEIATEARMQALRKRFGTQK